MKERGYFYRKGKMLKRKGTLTMRVSLFWPVQPNNNKPKKLGTQAPKLNNMQ